MCGCVDGGCWSLCVGVLMQIVFSFTSFSVCLSVCGCVDRGCWFLSVGVLMEAVGLCVWVSSCRLLVFVCSRVAG